MKKKIINLLWPLLYLILVVFVCASGCLIFHSYYYRSIFVDGESMMPTLIGGSAASDNLSYFGIINPHEEAINDIHRYNIVTTYYPWDENDYDQTEPYEPGIGRTTTNKAYYKIKRVVGIPGDIFKVEQSEFYLLPKSSPFYANLYDKTPEEISEFRKNYGTDYDKDLKDAFVKQDFPFERKLGKNLSIKDIGMTSLHYDEKNPSLNEYWVVGDNWSNSTDCGTIKKPIYQDNIVGVLVAIEGTCRIQSGKSADGNNNKTCEDRHYIKPIFFR